MNETKTPKVTKFIKRLFKIVNDDSFPEINWTEDGLRFFISDKNAFMSNGLKYVSKTTEYSAFLRLLYVYGFTKSKTLNANQEEYFHRNFQRNGERMLNCINRTVDKQSTLLAKSKTPNQLQDLLQYLNSQNFKLENEIRSLKERVDQQDLTINGLVQILGRMFRTSDHNVDLAINTNNIEKFNKNTYNSNFFNLENKKYTEENKKHRFDENYKKVNGNLTDISTKNKSIFDFDEDDQYEPSFF